MLKNIDLSVFQNFIILHDNAKKSMRYFDISRQQECDFFHMVLYKRSRGHPKH